MTNINKPNRPYVLSLIEVGVSYRRRTGFLRHDYFDAVQDISLCLREGDSLGIIGSNGAGKSTLLRLLSGIIRPDRGSVINHRRSVALLSLSLGFHPNLSGRDNAIMSGLLLGFRRKEVAERLDEIITFAELEEFIDFPLHTYSTGMRVRLGFAVAIQLDPDILLIDEVLGVGDVEFQRKSRAALEKKLTSEKSIVLTSHNNETIQTLCNRAIWIEHGRTVIEGGTFEVVRAYETYMQLEAEQQLNFLNHREQRWKSKSIDDLTHLLQEVLDDRSVSSLPVSQAMPSTATRSGHEKARESRKMHLAPAASARFRRSR